MEEGANYPGIRRSVQFWTAVTCHRFPTRRGSRCIGTSSKARPSPRTPNQNPAPSVFIPAHLWLGKFAFISLVAPEHWRRRNVIRVNPAFFASRNFLSCNTVPTIPSHSNLFGGVACPAFRNPSSALCKPASN
jgi:hypothetical protein